MDLQIALESVLIPPPITLIVAVVTKLVWMERSALKGDASSVANKSSPSAQEPVLIYKEIVLIVEHVEQVVRKVKFAIKGNVNFNALRV